MRVHRNMSIDRTWHANFHEAYSTSQHRTRIRAYFHQNGVSLQRSELSCIQPVRELCVSCRTKSKRKLTRARLTAPTTPWRTGTAGFAEIEKRNISRYSSANVAMKYEMLNCQEASRQSMNPPEIRCQPNPAISLRQTYCVHRPPFLQTRLCLGILR
jgi:hypothetical protein